MFWKQKEKLYLGQFLRLYLQGLLKSKIELPTNTEAKIDSDKFYEQLLYLRLIILMFLLLEIGRFGKQRYDLKSLGDLIQQAFVLSLVDVGVTKGSAEKKAKDFMTQLDDYTGYLGKVNRDELRKKGLYFHFILHFSDVIAGKGDIRDESFRFDSFTAFSYGNQIYKADKKALKDMLNKVEFLD